MKKAQVSIAILIIVYTVGLVGSIWFDVSILKLTPVNLLLSAFLLGLNHSSIDTRLSVFAGVVYAFSFILEALGVATGAIFGQYFYGENLGVKLFDTPLIIGLNWLILCYCSSVVSARLLANLSLPNKHLFNALLASFFMVGLDFLLEQVAPMVDFWYFKNQIVPFQNYTAWFVFAFAFNFLFQRLQIDTDNKVAPWLLGLQFAFFTGLCIAFSLFP